MHFSQVIGQDEIKQRLIRSVQDDRIAHAILLAGNEGIGKLGLALAYAQYVHCHNPGESDSCGQCPACHKHRSMVHPDLHFVFPIGKSDRVCDDYLSEWREELLANPYLRREEWMAALNAPNAPGIIYTKESDQITKKLNQKTFEADYKIMIIWLPERMHESAANKLLKILEEPFSKTLIILVSDTPEDIIGTILSRTQPLFVKPISSDIMMATLQQRFSLVEENARAIADLAGGSFARACELISVSDESRLFFDLFVRMMRNSWSRNVKGMKAWTDEVFTLGRERQKNFLNYMLRLIRENFIYNFRDSRLNYQNRDEADFSVKFAPYVNERNVHSFMETLTLAEQHINQNVNARMVFFDISLRITVLLKS